MPESDSTANAIDLRNIEFDWPGRRFGLSVDSFTVRRGEATLLVGDSGSGKSTLLSLIGGIALPQSGSVLVNGVELDKLSGHRRDRFRADTLGIIFQMFNLLPYATALDNILVPLQFSPERRARCPNSKSRALEIGEALGLPAALLTTGPASNLSVGQQQRVAVARALIGGPPIVIADEPTSALDANAQSEFLSLVLDQVNDAGATLLMVSHDMSLAPRFDHVIALTEIARPRAGAGT